MPRSTPPADDDGSSALLKAVQEEITEAMFMVNDQGIITSWNRGAELLFGYPAEAIVGKPCKVLSSNTCTGEFCVSMTAGDCPLFMNKGICSKRCEVHHSSGRKIHVLKNG